MRCLLFLAGVIGILSSGVSCKKDKTIQQPGCKVDTMFFRSGQYYYTYEYANGLFTRLNYYTDHFNIEYNFGKPVRRKYFAGPSLYANEYEDFQYNVNGTLSRIDLFEIIQPNFYHQYGKIVFSYSMNQLSKIELYSVTGTASTLEEDYTYISQSGNLVSCHAVDYLPAVQTGDITYTYDNNANYFKMQGPYTFFLEPVFMSSDPVILPMAVSKNNVTSFSGGSGNLTVRYELNDKKDLYFFEITNGINIRHDFRYHYKCD